MELDVRRSGLSPTTLASNIKRRKQELEAKLAPLAPGPKRDEVEANIRQMETVLHMDGWLRSPGLRPHT